ncbi:MAG: hypothetical protein ACK4KW_06615 [Gemmobacter sp.]
MFALVVMFQGAGPADPTEVEALAARLGQTPAMRTALIFTPATARDIYVDDGAAPPLGLQLLFDRLEELEGAAAHLADALAAVTSLRGTLPDAQAFWRRTFPVDDPVPRGERPCSYVVHYPGPAADPDAWHAHYIAGHPPLFRRFPGIRAIEILTPVDWICRLPARKVRHMQRNRVMFDSPEALTAALQSSVRHELRADFHSFPAFEGGNFHYPMITRQVVPG